DVLEERGFRETTIVIFTSDHGEMAGDHQRLNKRVFYEESARIPLIVSIPGATTAGSGCNALVDNLDIFPTLLEIGDCPPSNRCRALSLLPLLSDPRLTLKGEVFSEVARETNSGRFTRTTMVRTDRYKYAVDDLGRGFMLFDMAEDPQENNNLVGNPNCRDVEADMQGRLLNFMLNTQYEQHFPGARRK
ncbi:MAG TPA: sulfatase/phosphatase domain-containing protein, partial [Spirochaetia bacterium]|nr:sulfatase/phosphatase domain-containing protein [Spirochaetia bacterium]